MYASSADSNHEHFKRQQTSSTIAPCDKRHLQTSSTIAPCDMLRLAILAIFAMYMCLGTSKTLNWTTCKNAHVTFKRTLNCSEYQPRRSVHHFDFWHLNRSHAGLRLFLFTGVSQKHSKDHMHDTVLRHRETPHRHSHRVIDRSLVPSDLETSSLNKHQLNIDALYDLETSSLNKHQLKLFEQLGNDYKKMRSEYQAQVIDRTLVPKKMMSKKMLPGGGDDIWLSILCEDLSRAGGIITNNFERHGAVLCRKAKLRGELDWWSDNLHDEQWIDHFLFTHGAIVDILVYVILMYFAYVFLLFFKSAYWHIRAYGF